MLRPEAHPGTPYRPDIDGLRAIAVLAVIVFHISRDLLPGGFVGVDIFFVISGYLISRNIFLDIEHGRFSVVNFYRKRVKRIMPPMLVVVLLSIVTAQLIMRPEDAEHVAKSGLWSVASLANVYFWRYQDTSYFATASSELPLLHLWSLGVEEQFYIIWPLFLLLIYRPSRESALFILVSIAALLSFGLGQAWFANHASFSYYMLPTRAGELLLGALTALLILHQEKPLKPAAAGALASVGLALLAGSLACINENQVFPGLLAIPPTLGTALIIFAGNNSQNSISRYLAFKPLRWIGLISYSAYLWHWPLLAFYRYGHTQISIWAGCILFILTIVLAWLSYLLVELPARTARSSAIRIFTLQYALPASAIAALAGIAIFLHGYGLRWDSADYKKHLSVLQARTKAAYEFDYVCQRQRVISSDLLNEHCVLGADKGGSVRTILWGDSNAAHYVGMIGIFANEATFRFRNIAVGSCPPLFSDPAPFVDAKRLSDCRASTKTISDEINNYDTIIISANWPSYLQNSGNFLDIFFDEVRSFTKNGKKIILIGKAPVIPGYDRLCNEKALSYPWLECPLKTATPLSEVVNVNRQLSEFATKTPMVYYFDIDHYLCRNGECAAFNGKKESLYYDPHHLSLQGSWELGAMIAQQTGVPEIFKNLNKAPQKNTVQISGNETVSNPKVPSRTPLPH